MRLKVVWLWRGRREDMRREWEREGNMRGPPRLLAMAAAAYCNKDWIYRFNQIIAS